MNHISDKWEIKKFVEKLEFVLTLLFFIKIGLHKLKLLWLLFKYSKNVYAVTTTSKLEFSKYEIFDREFSVVK